LIIVDEAHKMSAYSADKKTLAYQLGESLSQMTDHYLLMTATPHKGDPENFCLFLSLLDKDVYGNIKSLDEAMAKHEAPFYLRRLKEALVSFPDPETGIVKALFTKRIVHTTPFQISDERARSVRPTHPLRRGPIHQGSTRRYRARSCRRIHDGYAPAAVCVQYLCRAQDAGAHERKARKNPRRSRQVWAGTDQ
jgi:superfamily II DNA or RNA helicase